MKAALLFSLVLGACVSFGQFNISKPGKNTLPKSIHYNGQIVNATRWTDSLGDNILVVTATGETQSKNTGDEGYRDAAIYAYHYSVRTDSCKLTWKVYDFIKDCPVDIDLYFINKAFAITDLNKDGRAEVWLLYKNSCHGDVSPVPMKIIMYENNRKFAARGTTKVNPAPGEYMGGEFSFDEAFKKGPVEFRQYAEKLWAQNKIENRER